MEFTIVKIHPMEVLQSAAGYYVGTLCTTQATENGKDLGTFKEPYDRMSGYFKTKEAAQKELEFCQRSED